MRQWLVVGVAQALQHDKLGVVGQPEIGGHRGVDGGGQPEDIASWCGSLRGNGVKE